MDDFERVREEKESFRKKGKTLYRVASSTTGGGGGEHERERDMSYQSVSSLGSLQLPFYLEVTICVKDGGGWRRLKERKKETIQSWIMQITDLGSQGSPQLSFYINTREMVMCLRERERGMNNKGRKKYG